MKATWLFDKQPLVIDVKLAQAIGLNEAIVLQQINYWLHGRHAKKINGRLWTYNSIKNWNEQFPFWSERTIKRVFSSLEKDGLLVTGNFNKYKFDKTKWYSIDVNKVSNRLGQFDPVGSDKMAPSDSANLAQPIPETTENTSETNNNSQAEPDKTTQLRKEIISYLNEKLGTKYKPNAAKNKTVINARLKEGYSLDDFKTVVDNKIADWSNSSKMSKFLRPETLFGPKFDGYLSEKRINQKSNTHQGKGWFDGFNRE